MAYKNKWPKNFYYALWVKTAKIPQKRSFIIIKTSFLTFFPKTMKLQEGYRAERSHRPDDFCILACSIPHSFAQMASLWLFLEDCSISAQSWHTNSTVYLYFGFFDTLGTPGCASITRKNLCESEKFLCSLYPHRKALFLYNI